MDYTTRRLYGQYFTRWRCQLPNVKKTRAHGDKRMCGPKPTSSTASYEANYRGNLEAMFPSAGSFRVTTKPEALRCDKTSKPCEQPTMVESGSSHGKNGLCLLVAQQTPRLRCFVRVRTLRRHRPLISGFGPGTRPMLSAQVGDAVPISGRACCRRGDSTTTKWAAVLLWRDRRQRAAHAARSAQ
jgi:hypothetical protein